MVKRWSILIVSLLCVVASPLTYPASAAATGTREAIQFDNDPPGEKPNGWTSVDSTIAHFADSMGSDLLVYDAGPESHGQGLGVFWDDPSYLIIQFDVEICGITLAFGNDDPCCSEDGKARLAVSLGGTLTGRRSVELNGNDRMDQRIVIRGVTFDRVAFRYDINPAFLPGMIEVVDDIYFWPC